MATEIVAPPRHPHATLVQWLTIVHGLLEGGASLLASSLAGSVALLSFGLDSMIEVLSALVVLWRLTSLGRSHRLALSERNGLRLIGICFLALAISVAFDAIQALVREERPHESLLGIIVAAVSLAVMPFLATAKRRISGEIDSHAMRADARQTDFCAYLAAILLLGLLAYKLFGWWWADPAAALVMTPIMAWEGIQAWRGHACGCASCS
ncbi:MAG TPA: cation transporter [Fimbriimonadaceae bacterium]|nr:cation transporter [Fimbriimonadaceae bacterium]